MAYTVPTLTEAQDALASRLNDQLFVRWTAAECATYLREALRTWNAWTQFYRSSESFTTTMIQAFYDLPTVLPTTRPYTVTNWDLVADLQYTLLEPVAPGGTWTGTDQFTLEQLSNAIQRRRDQFLRETGAVITQQTVAFPAPPASGRIALDESILNVRRAAWRPTATTLLNPLLRTDEWATTNFRPGWLVSPRAPYAYSTTVTPPLTLQLIPPTTLAGTLDLVSVNKGAAIDPLVETPLGIPDDWSWVVKYGALADLLQGDGLALDPGRAQYCELRWEQGIRQATTAAVVLAARINDQPIPIGSLNDADQFSPLWQLVAGTPRRLLTSGQSLVALWPPPGATGGPWTIALDVVANMPIPVAPTDVLQVSADIYDTILDIAQHTALAKEGPGQLQIATALLERAARAAGVDLALQQASQPSREPVLQQTRADEHSSVPRELEPIPLA